MFHPENNRNMKAQALKNLQRIPQKPDVALAIDNAEMLEPQALAFILSGQMVQEVKSESIYDMPVEKGLENDFSGAVITPDAYNNIENNTPLYLGDLVGGV